MKHCTLAVLWFAAWLVLASCPAKASESLSTFSSSRVPLLEGDPKAATDCVELYEKMERLPYTWRHFLGNIFDAYIVMRQVAFVNVNKPDSQLSAVCGLCTMGGKYFKSLASFSLYSGSVTTIIMDGGVTPILWAMQRKASRTDLRPRIDIPLVYMFLNTLCFAAYLYSAVLPAGGMYSMEDALAAMDEFLEDKFRWFISADDFAYRSKIVDEIFVDTIVTAALIGVRLIWRVAMFAPTLRGLGLEPKGRLGQSGISNQYSPVRRAYSRTQIQSLQ